MDVHMPKVSGFDATLRMREMEIDRGMARCASGGVVDGCGCCCL